MSSKVLLEPGTTDQVIGRVFPDETPWEPEGRAPLEEYQRAPEGMWNLWLLEAGRGAGKTEACARYFARYMRLHPGARGRIIAPTLGDAVEACIIGPSGLEAMDPTIKLLKSDIGGTKVLWPNGSEALVIGTPTPRDVNRLRAGGNRELDWWEEAAANPQLKDAWDQAAFGLRLADHTRPHAIASTTPRNTTPYRAIRGLPDTVFTKASLFDNPHNPKAWVEMMRRKYEGTRLGRQELRGELLDDVEGALWSRTILDAARVPREKKFLPDMQRLVVAIDPAGSSASEAADTGIIVVGEGVDGFGWILDDRTCHLSPDGWGTRAVRSYKKWRADRIVGEVNFGGEMVEHVISTIDRRVPFKAVRASRGKAIRAEPVATLFGDGKKRPTQIKMWGAFPELEDQLCTWVPGEGDPSPDRYDAMVWGVTDLFLEEEEQEYIIEEYEPVRIGADI
jgi:phage terminase large subunit-like protein